MPVGSGRLLPHGLPHSVYVARCTPGEYGNKLDEDDADSLHFAFISFYSARSCYYQLKLPTAYYSVFESFEDNAA